MPTRGCLCSFPSPCHAEHRTPQTAISHAQACEQFPRRTIVNIERPTSTLLLMLMSFAPYQLGRTYPGHGDERTTAARGCILQTRGTPLALHSGLHFGAVLVPNGSRRPSWDLDRTVYLSSFPSSDIPSPFPVEHGLKEAWRIPRSCSAFHDQRYVCVHATQNLSSFQ